MLSGEDDFDLAGPSTRRGLGFFGSLKRNRNDIEEYRDGSRDPQGPTNVGGENPEMRQIDEPPPRILRPVASKTGSYFQEAVWPPPEEGSRIVDPLMVASSVDLTSIVDEVMGPNPRSAGSIPRSSGSFDAGPSAWTSRLRGGAEGFNESGFDLGAAELHSAGYRYHGTQNHQRRPQLGVPLITSEMVRRIRETVVFRRKLPFFRVWIQVCVVGDDLVVILGRLRPLLALRFTLIHRLFRL